ncbi:CGNR zinc finger domain-containing protein [Nonomuraea angiospora]
MSPASGGRQAPLIAELDTELRQALPADQAARINAMIRRYGAQPYLVDDVGQPFHLHFHGSGGTQVEALGGEFATAPALVVDGYGPDRFGQCEAVYIDLTRNASRRHCSTACTARAKTAAYRSRRQS